MSDEGDECCLQFCQFGCKMLFHTLDAFDRHSFLCKGITPEEAVYCKQCSIYIFANEHELHTIMSHQTDDAHSSRFQRPTNKDIYSMINQRRSSSTYNISEGMKNSAENSYSSVSNRQIPSSRLQPITHMKGAFDQPSSVHMGTSSNTYNRQNRAHLQQLPHARSSLTHRTSSPVNQFSASTNEMRTIRKLHHSSYPVNAQVVPSRLSTARDPNNQDRVNRFSYDNNTSATTLDVSCENKINYGRSIDPTTDTVDSLRPGCPNRGYSASSSSRYEKLLPHSQIDSSDNLTLLNRTLSSTDSEVDDFEVKMKTEQVRIQRMKLKVQEDELALQIRRSHIKKMERRISQRINLRQNKQQIKNKSNRGDPHHESGFIMPDKSLGESSNNPQQWLHQPKSIRGSTFSSKLEQEDMCNMARENEILSDSSMSEISSELTYKSAMFISHSSNYGDDFQMDSSKVKRTYSRTKSASSEGSDYLNLKSPKDNSVSLGINDRFKPNPDLSNSSKSLPLSREANNSGYRVTSLESSPMPNWLNLRKKPTELSQEICNYKLWNSLKGDFPSEKQGAQGYTSTEGDLWQPNINTSSPSVNDLYPISPLIAENAAETVFHENIPIDASQSIISNEQVGKVMGDQQISALSNDIAEHDAKRSKNIPLISETVATNNERTICSRNNQLAGTSYLVKKPRRKRIRTEPLPSSTNIGNDSVLLSASIEEGRLAEGYTLNNTNTAIKQIHGNEGILRNDKYHFKEVNTDSLVNCSDLPVVTNDYDIIDYDLCKDKTPNRPTADISTLNTIEVDILNTLEAASSISTSEVLATIADETTTPTLVRETMLSNHSVQALLSQATIEDISDIGTCNKSAILIESTSKIAADVDPDSPCMDSIPSNTNTKLMPDIPMEITPAISMEVMPANTTEVSFAIKLKNANEPLLSADTPQHISTDNLAIPRRKRGRPRKYNFAKPDISADFNVSLPQTKPSVIVPTKVPIMPRRQGRPSRPWNVAAMRPVVTEESNDNSSVVKSARKRGRPRKINRPVNDNAGNEGTSKNCIESTSNNICDGQSNLAPKIKRKPGRPALFPKPVMTGGPTTCGVCELTFEDKRTFIRHAERVHNGLARPLGESLEFDKKERLYRFKEALTKHKKLTCEICQKVYRSFLGFDYHNQMCGKLESEKYKQCLVCKEFVRITHMPKHTSEHRKPKESPSKFQELSSEEGGTPRSKRRCSVMSLERILTINQEVCENPYLNVGRKSALTVSRRLPSDGTSSLIAKFISIGTPEINDIITKLNDGITTKCPNQLCELFFTEASCFRKHIRNCVEAAYSYFCKACKFTTDCNAEINIHIKEHWSAPDLENFSPQFPLNRRPFGIHSLRLCHEFRAENYSDHLFTDITCNIPEWLLINGSPSALNSRMVQLSVSFKINSSTICNDWTNLHAGGCCSNESGSVIYAGGNILASAWCPMPANTDGMQYLALASSAESGSTNIHDGQLQGCNLIQIWAIDIAQEMPEAVMVFGFECDNGNCFSLQWCPSGAYQVANDSFERMGILAAAFEDGSVCLYAIPHPHQLSHLNAIYSKRPDMVLTSFGFTPFESSCRKIDWYLGKGHEYLGACYSCGSVSIWDFTNKSEPWRITDSEGNKVLRSSLSFQAHLFPCTSISFCPNTNGKHIVTTALDRITRIWDLDCLDHPLSDFRKGVATDSLWMPYWSGVVLSFDQSIGIHTMGTIFKESDFLGGQTIGMLPSNGNVWCLAGSYWYNGVAQGSETSVSLLINHKATLTETPKSFNKMIYQVFDTSVEEVHSSNDEESSENCKQFGICFYDDSNTPTHDLSPPEVRDKDVVNKLRISTSICWNNNYNGHDWMFVSNKGGLGRFLNLRLLVKK